MMFGKFRASLCVLGTLTSLGFAGAANAVVIAGSGSISFDPTAVVTVDSFDQAFGNLAATIFDPPPVATLESTVTDTDTTGTFLGDSRTATIVSNSPTSFSTASIAGSALNFNTGTAGASLTLDYDVIPGGVDLTAGGLNQSFAFSVPSDNDGSFEVGVEVVNTTLGGTASASVTVDASAVDDFDVLFLFDEDFTASAGTVESILAGATSLQLTLSSPDGGNIAFDGFAFSQAVPFEMESAAGLTILGLGAAWKLRKRKTVVK